MTLKERMLAKVRFVPTNKNPVKPPARSLCLALVNPFQMRETPEANPEDFLNVSPECWYVF